MDKFLEILCSNQLQNDNSCDDIFRPFENALRKIVSDNLFDELMELFTECMAKNNDYYALAGMKLAIGILDGTYVPVV